jgi:hypothetical protein
MLQQGQVFELETRGPEGKRLWAYRHRPGGATRSACSAAVSAARRMPGPRWSAGDPPTRERGRPKGHPRRIRRRVPRTARSLAGDAREAARSSRARGVRLWRLPPRRARPGRDLGMAEDGPARLSIRGDPGASAGARQSSRMAHARCQSREAGGRKPAATAHREAPLSRGSSSRRSRIGSGRAWVRWCSLCRCDRNATGRMGRPRAP